MARFTIPLLTALLALTGCDTATEAPRGDEPSAEGIGAAPSGTTFGSEFTQTEVVSVDGLLANPEPYLDQAVRVEGTVVEVCEKRGCWLSLGGESGEVLTVKVRDGEMVFPMTARGLSAQVEGTLTGRELSVEDQIKRGEHLAEESGETFDPATVTGPKTLYKLSPSAVRIDS